MIDRMMWIFSRKKGHIRLETLSEYMDGRLSPDRHRRVARHLEACSRCAGEMESLEQTVGLLRQVPMVGPRRSFVLGEEAVGAPARRETRMPVLAYGAAAVVAVLLFAVVLSADLSGALSQGAPAPAASRTDAQVLLAATPSPQPTSMPAPTGMLEAEAVVPPPQELQRDQEAVAPSESQAMEAADAPAAAPVSPASEEAAPAPEMAAAPEGAGVETAAAPFPTPSPVEAAPTPPFAPVSVSEAAAPAPEMAMASESAVVEATAVPVPTPLSIEAAATAASEEATPAPEVAMAPEVTVMEATAAPVPTPLSVAAAPEIAMAQEGAVREATAAPVPTPLRAAANSPPDRQPGRPEQESAYTSSVEEGEALGITLSEATGGGTALLWRVLEGVSGGLALLIVAGVLLRRRRL